MTTTTLPCAIQTTVPNCYVTPDLAALAAGFASYRAYLSSQTWRRSPARLKALSVARGHCRLCHAGRGALECHHSNYERLGAGRFGDVIALCRPCHKVVTAMLRERDESAYELDKKLGEAEQSKSRERVLAEDATGEHDATMADACCDGTDRTD